MTLSGRYESGVPLEVEADRLADLMTAPGVRLVDFERQRVKPWAVADVVAGWEPIKKDRVAMRMELSVQNLTNRAFVYNFGNPFSGTHFGYPRLWSGRVSLNFHTPVPSH